MNSDPPAFCMLPCLRDSLHFYAKKYVLLHKIDDILCNGFCRLYFCITKYNSFYVTNKVAASPVSDFIVDGYTFLRWMLGKSFRLPRGYFRINCSSVSGWAAGV